METEDTVVATLQAHEAELRAADMRTLSLFGSAARGDGHAESDVDVAVELDPGAHVGDNRECAVAAAVVEEKKRCSRGNTGRVA